MKATAFKAGLRRIENFSTTHFSFKRVDGARHKSYSKNERSFALCALAAQVK
jgi:hypothetical protein